MAVGAAAGARTPEKLNRGLTAGIAGEMAFGDDQ